MEIRDRRFHRLYKFLDTNGLDWLSDEVRAFATALPSKNLSESEIINLRTKRQALSTQNPAPEVEQKFPINHEIKPINFDDCILYIIDRIEDLISYLEASRKLANEIEIGEIQFSSETNFTITQGGFKSEVQHLPTSKVHRCTTTSRSTSNSNPRIA